MTTLDIISWTNKVLIPALLVTLEFPYKPYLDSNKIDYQRICNTNSLVSTKLCICIEQSMLLITSGTSKDFSGITMVFNLLLGYSFGLPIVRSIHAYEKVNAPISLASCYLVSSWVCVCSLRYDSKDLEKDLERIVRASKIVSIMETLLCIHTWYVWKQNFRGNIFPRNHEWQSKKHIDVLIFIK